MGSTKISQPSTPAAPTTAQNMQDYVNNLPALYDAQLKYSPLFNQQDYEQTAIYAPLMKSIQDQMYPNTSAIPEQIAGIASQGATGELSDAQKSTYQDAFRAEIGNQAGSGMGADYVSRNMQNQQFEQQKYYQNMALSVAGMQPLSQSGSYQQAYNPSSTYSYGQVAGDNMSGYGSYAGAYSSMYNTNGQLRANVNSVNQGYAQMGVQGLGSMMMSSIVLKENVEPISKAIEVVKRLQGVKYDWKANGLSDGGFIAEEVEKVIPDATADIDGIKHIKPMMIIGYLLEAVKELEARLPNTANASV
jgi:hypothetical protein